MAFTTLDLSKQSGTSLPSSIVTASGLSTGKLLQTQSTSSTSRTTISSTSFTGCGLEDTITCSSASSKVLVMISANYTNDSNNASVDRTQNKFQITRNHSGISETEIYRTVEGEIRPENSGMDMIFNSNLSIMFLDSPSTTNELTYSLKALMHPSTSGMEIAGSGTNEFNKTITLIEIGA